jgi:hypothetical protein
MLPVEVIWHIQSFMRWRHATRMVSKEWLRRALKKRVRIRTWGGHMRVYSYLRVFGQTFVGMSWGRFCDKLYIRRRQRNRHFRLTWKAAAQSCMKTKRCQACGCHSNSNVFGISLCSTCRFNPKLKYAFMVNTATAKRMGIPSHVLQQIAYHRVGQSHLRFWHEIIHFI